MGCIIANRGTVALCGEKQTVHTVVEFFQNKITCVPCLIRQDAMFARDYQQKKFACWYNRWGMRQCIPYDEYNRYYSTYHTIPHKSVFVGIVAMWDMQTLKGAVKLGKMGVHGMGLAKEE